MRTYTWDEYYEKFYEWAESTRIKNLTYLENLGDPEEVTEILLELKDNPNASTRLLRKAIEEKVKFTGENILDLFFWEFDKELLMKVLWNSADILTAEDIEGLYLTVDDAVLLQLCEKGNIPVPEDLREDVFWELEEEFIEDEEIIEYPKQKKIGFFGHAFAILAAIGSVSSSNKNNRHSGRCDGDCANCPPHYGYRYGRWYYGKGHVHGCQFGGNRGNGGF